jgi:cell division septation protein DedD
VFALKPTCFVKNEKGSMVVVLALLAVIVIAAVVLMQLMHGTSTPPPASPPAVVKMKIPPTPRTKPKKANVLPPPSEMEGRVETPSDQPHDDSTPAEANVNSPAAPASPANASGAAGTPSAQPSVTAGADSGSPSATAGAPTAIATRPAQKKAEVAPQQKASADGGKPEQAPAPGVDSAVAPGAASKSANDLVETEAAAVAAAKVPETPADQNRPKPTATATAPEKEAPFTVQVGAFHTKSYADAELEKLKGLGYPAYLFRLLDKKQHPLYLVCFGRFRTLAEAGDAMAAFKKKENMAAVVARPGSW